MFTAIAALVLRGAVVARSRSVVVFIERYLELQCLYELLMDRVNSSQGYILVGYFLGQPG